MASKSVCKIDGCCNGGRITRGLCSSHYHRLQRHGDPLAGRTPKGEALDWIKSVALLHQAEACLPWPFYRRPDGRAGMNPRGEGSWLAHHVLCELVYGPPPTPEHIACHACGNGHEGCMNPGHLYWGTKADNSADMVVHGNSTRGEKAEHSILRETDVQSIRARAGLVTQQQMADEFGVHIMTINDVIHRRTWGWLD